MNSATNQQQCPICQTELRQNERYPNHLCNACAANVTDSTGRKVKFYNADMSGGCIAEYTDTGETYPSNVCYVDGFACVANEARFGGIVVCPTV